MVHLANFDDVVLTVANVAQPYATRPHASQDDVDHAADVQLHVLLLPSRSRAVLAGQQHLVDCSAMGD